MKNTGLTNLLIGLVLLLTTMFCTESVPVYYPSDLAAVQFAAKDHQQNIENTGNNVE